MGMIIVVNKIYIHVWSRPFTGILHTGIDEIQSLTETGVSIIISDRRNKKLDKLYFSGVIFFLKMFCMNSTSY